MNRGFLAAGVGKGIDLAYVSLLISLFDYCIAAASGEVGSMLSMAKNQRYTVLHRGGLETWRKTARRSRNPAGLSRVQNHMRPYVVRMSDARVTFSSPCLASKYH